MDSEYLGGCPNVPLTAERFEACIIGYESRLGITLCQFRGGPPEADHRLPIIISCSSRAIEGDWPVHVVMHWQSLQCLVDDAIDPIP